MPVRLFPVLIVLFWMGSVAWLCVVVWAPPGSRMAEVDPREVYRVFFAWNDSTKMTLLENGLRRGEVTVSGGSGIEAESGVFERVLSLSGSTETYDDRAASPLVELFWKGTLAFTADMASRGGEVSVRIPGKELSAHLAFDPPAIDGTANSVKAKVLIAGREVLTFDTGLASGDPAKAMALLGQFGGLPGLGSLDPSILKHSVEARMGRFNLAGREMRAFLLILRGEEAGQEVRIYLSEAGEPLRIETDLGFEAVSEILVPLDAYQRPPSSK